MFRLLVLFLFMCSCPANSQANAQMMKVKPSQIFHTASKMTDSTGRKLVFKHISYTM